MLNFDTDALESVVAGLPAEPPGLDPESAVRFRAARARVGRRHREWRAGLPTLMTLFEDDAHQAKALAGNLATELQGVLRAGVTSAVDAGTRPGAGSIAAWVDDSARQWRAGVREALGVTDWAGEPRDVFDGFLDELTDKARRGSLELIPSGRARAAGAAVGGTVAGALAWLAGPLRRLFRPAPGP